jgi:protein-S-isoprenylcysteine O-methyltransferase Ste14
MTRFENLFVWGGGAIFVISLAACAYFYLVIWASPAPADGGWTAVQAAAINALLFAAFALHHSLFARESIKTHVARVVPEHLLRSLYVWTASVLLLAVLVLWQPVAGNVYVVTGWPAALHTAVQLIGLWLIARSVAQISPLDLAGIKPASVKNGSTVLQVGGPYNWVRHPLYLGWLLALFGAAQMTADRFAFAAISTAYLLVAIPWEERSLLRVFGEPYARYQRTVRWRVVPYVY